MDVDADTAVEAAVDMAAAAAAALHMPAAVAALVPVSAALVPVSAALVPVSAALVPVLSVALADAHFMYTAGAPFLDAASAAVAVAAEAAAVGAAELAGYGHPPGAGSTPAGPNLHLRVKKLASRLMRPVTRPLASCRRRRRRVHAIVTRRHLPSPQKAEALGKSRS